MNKIEKNLSLLLLLTGLFACNQTLFTYPEEGQPDRTQEQKSEAKTQEENDERLRKQDWFKTHITEWHSKAWVHLKDAGKAAHSFVFGKPKEGVLADKSPKAKETTESTTKGNANSAITPDSFVSTGNEQLKADEQLKAKAKKVTKDFNKAYNQFDDANAQSRLFTDKQISELKTLSLQILGLDPRENYTDLQLYNAQKKATTPEEEKIKSRAVESLELVERIERDEAKVKSVSSLAELTWGEIKSLNPITFNRLTDEQIKQRNFAQGFANLKMSYDVKNKLINMLEDRNTAIKAANAQKLADESNAQEEADQKAKDVVKKEAARRQNLADTQEDEAMNRINQREKTNAEKFEVANKMNEKYTKAFGIKGMRNIDLITLTEEEISELKTLSCQLLGLDPKNYTDKDIDDALNKTNKSTIFSGNEYILAQTKKAYFFLKEEAQQAEFLKTDQAIIAKAKSLSNLTADQVKSLHRITIRRLTVTQISELRELQIANLTIEQIKTFSDIQLKTFSRDKIGKLISRFDSFKSIPDETKQSFNARVTNARKKS